MADFEPGDIVIYERTRAGSAARNGSMGIVKIQYHADQVEVDWWICAASIACVFPENLRKVGRLEPGDGC
jgi:hypothetical protein